MKSEALGKTFKDGEIIIRQGEVGDCMYVVQAGQVEVFQKLADSEVRLATMGEGEFFGEMALFEREVRSATVRAVGEARVLTVDRHTLLRRFHEDPSLAYRLVQTLSQRLRRSNTEFMRVQSEHPSAMP
jgi:CRP-like cAMP-binding protein